MLPRPEHAATKVKASPTCPRCAVTAPQAACKLGPWLHAPRGLGCVHPGACQRAPKGMPTCPRKHAMALVACLGLACLPTCLWGLPWPWQRACKHALALVATCPWGAAFSFLKKFTFWLLLQLKVYFQYFKNNELIN